MISKILTIPLISILALSLSGCSVSATTEQPSESASSNISQVPVTDLGASEVNDETKKNNVMKLTGEISTLLSNSDFASDIQKYLDTGEFNAEYKDQYNSLTSFVDEDEAFTKEYNDFVKKSKEGDTVFNVEDSKNLAKLKVITQTYQLGYLDSMEGGSFGVDISALKDKDGGMVLDKSGAMYVQNKDGIIYHNPFTIGLTTFTADGTKLTVGTILSDQSKHEESYGNYMEANNIMDQTQAWIMANADKVEEETELSIFTEDILKDADVAQGTSLSIEGTPKYYTIGIESKNGTKTAIDSNGEIVEDATDDPLNLEPTSMSEAWSTYESIYSFTKSDKSKTALEDIVAGAANAESPKGSKWAVGQIDGGEKYVQVTVDTGDYKFYDITSVVG